MTEEEFGQWVVNTFNIDIELDSTNATKTPEGMNEGTVTLKRGNDEKEFPYMWGNAVELPIPDDRLIYAFILDWDVYENDKQTAFETAETIEAWERYMEEITFLETIFNEEEKAEILNEFANIY